MRSALACAVLVGIMVILSSCPRERGKRARDYERPKEALGIHIGSSSFSRQELTKAGVAGRGLIRIDWNADGKDDIVLLRSVRSLEKTNIALMDERLEFKELFSIAAETQAPTAADMDGDGLPELCTGGSWGLDPVIYNHEGDRLFVYRPCEYATDEATLADLKGNGNAVLIAGHNAYGGLRAADISGKAIFKDDRDLGNVWSVEAADLDGDGILEIINSWGVGDLEVWSSEFKHLITLNPPEYTSGLAAVDHDGDGKDSLLLESGRLIDGEGNTIYPGDGSDGMPFPSFAVTADISDSEGLETAWAQVRYNNFKIFAQDGTVLYHEGFAQVVTGLISTEGLEGWEPGFMVQFADGTLIHYTRAK